MDSMTLEGGQHLHQTTEAEEAEQEDLRKLEAERAKFYQQVDSEEFF